MRPPGGRGRAAVAAGGVAAGLGAAAALSWGGYDVPAALAAPTLVLDLAVGWSFVGTGLLAWSRHPDNRTGALMVVLGFAALGRYAVAVASDVGFAVGVLLGSLYLSVFVHLLVTFPTGRATTWPQRVTVTVGYLLSTPLDGFFLLLGATRGAPAGLPPNGLVIVPAPAGSPVLVDAVVQGVVLALCTAVLAIVAARWRRASTAERRAIGPGLLGGVLVVLALMAQRSAFVLAIHPDVRVGFTWAARTVLVVWPLALLFGLVRSRLDRSAVSRMIVELGAGPPGPERLRGVLAATLHDPSVAIAYWLPERGVFVDARGDPAAVEPPAPGRGVTYLERGGSRIAALTHDAALAGEPELVAAVAAGAGMALENERLHAEVRARLREVQASRARIVESADAARRRVERDLHDGAQQRLVNVALLLRMARGRLSAGPPGEVDALLGETVDELAGALEELRELARGIYPALLTDSGLGPALAALAERSSVPAVVTGAPPGRLPGALEHAAYFVVSEGLANAAKHAAAAEVRIDVRVTDGVLVVAIADDGVGGASLAGAGLRGLVDRVAAAGGRLRLASPAGGGTRLTAELPIAPAVPAARSEPDARRAPSPSP
ncbi:Histidine kinase [Geodermatophilus telluris]|uniref:histidine kinase n=1 Tax=Geodermatophilus telluris TaxID=1190417 RepID=A0A1G6TN12_9ACTN|nr:histidine kinase [Geodermatophilus telluris]SDD29725.1 Histidine kinase [Geodermatophilus telluris]